MLNTYPKLYIYNTEGFDYDYFALSPLNHVAGPALIRVSQNLSASDSSAVWLTPHQDSDSAGLGCGLRFCSFNKPQGMSLTRNHTEKPGARGPANILK